MKPFYLTVLLLAYSTGSLAVAVECAYVPAPAPGHEYSELTPTSECGNLADPDTLIINDELLKKLYFDDHGLATMRFQEVIFYITKNGKTAPTIYFDNGPDYFVEGLARTTKNKKIGFMDEKLNIIIAPAYDFASPFHNGYAVVCNGCTWRGYGEHKRMVGGVWGKIDKLGKIVAPLRPDDNKRF